MMETAGDLRAAADLIEKVGHWRSGHIGRRSGSTCAVLALVTTIGHPLEVARQDRAEQAMLDGLGFGDTDRGYMASMRLFAWNDANDEATVVGAMREAAGLLHLSAALADEKVGCLP